MVLSRDNLVALMYCHDAIEYYKKSKNVKQLKRMEAKYSELKSSMALKCSKFNFDMSDILKFCSELTEDLLTKESNYIISYLINSPHLLPRYQFMDQMAVDQLNQFAFISLFPETIIDDRGHIVEHVSTNEEKRYHQILFNYNVAIDMNTIPMVNSILLEAVRNNKLTLDSLLHYFKENTWFGKNINRNLPNNTTYTYNWINFLVPSLHEYFLQLNYYFNSEKYPNFILSIDSLSPKLEGILRDLCEFLEIEAFKFTKDKNNRRIALEKDITMLLHEDKIREFIGEDDLLFYKYLLVEQSGLKLRHQIAHQLIKYEEYNLNTMNLLILALLRLGKYDFIK